MYIVKNRSGSPHEPFDWSRYFTGSSMRVNAALCTELVVTLRHMLTENPISITFVLSTMMLKLLRNYALPAHLHVLELGAATGLLTRWLVHKYDGKGLLIDNNKEAYQRYLDIVGRFKNECPIDYLVEDIFKIDLKEKFDVVCSFGLLEHFREKDAIIALHKRFLKEKGFIIILVPIDSYLSRVYWEIHPELNVGYRELLTQDEFIQVLEQHRLKVFNSVVSVHYVYDFCAAICQPI